jgi:hypothetical protein
VLITDCLTEARWLDGAPMTRGRGESHFPNHPQELAERYYHVTSWAEHPTGGHLFGLADVADGAHAEAEPWIRT